MSEIWTYIDFEEEQKDTLRLTRHNPFLCSSFEEERDFPCIWWEEVES